MGPPYTVKSHCTLININCKYTLQHKSAPHSCYEIKSINKSNFIGQILNEANS